MASVRPLHHRDIIIEQSVSASEIVDEALLKDVYLHDGDSASTSDKLPLLKDVANTSESTTIVENGPYQGWSIARTKGLSYIIFSALNFSIASACIKYDSGYVGSQEVMLWRSVVGLALNYVWLRRQKVSLDVHPSRRSMLLFRIVVGTLSMSVRFYAMANMVLTDATVIIFTSPTMTFLLGAVFLQEQIDRTDFLCALLSFTGVVFVARPTFLFPTDSVTAAAAAAAAVTKETRPLAVAAAIAGSITQSIVYICMRKLKDVDPLVSTHYLMLASVLFAVIAMWFANENFVVPTNAWAIFALVATATFSSVGQIFMTLGFQHEKAGIASVMRYFDVLFVLILDVAVLREQVSVYSIVGGTIILVGAVVIVMRRAHTS